jgi:hypothetical protein
MDPDPGGPKTCGSGGSGFGTLWQGHALFALAIYYFFLLVNVFDLYVTGIFS